MEPLKKLEATVNVDDLYTQLSGRKGLRTGKPKNLLAAYVWRMVRFHSGIDPTIPVTCFWDLQDYCDSVVGKNVVKVDGISNDMGKAFLKTLDPVIDLLCARFGYSPYGAALRWKGLLY